MRWSLLMCISLILGAGLGLHAQEVPKTPSTLEKDAKGWLDLFPGKDLKGWRRVPIPPDVKLDARNPWSVDAKNKVLVCDGVGIKEMFLFDKPFTNGVFHVEWRFQKTKDQFGYNGGIYVRAAKDATAWVQAQVAHLEKPPLVADLFADVPKNGKAERVIVTGTGHKYMRPVGEWNSCEVTCKGKSIQVWLNGHVVTMWNDCPLAQGHVGLQAEFYYLEFRTLKFKEQP